MPNLRFEHFFDVPPAYVVRDANQSLGLSPPENSGWRGHSHRAQGGDYTSPLS